MRRRQIAFLVGTRSSIIALRCGSIAEKFPANFRGFSKLKKYPPQRHGYGLSVWLHKEPYRLAAIGRQPYRGLPIQLSHGFMTLQPPYCRHEFLIRQLCDGTSPLFPRRPKRQLQQ